MVATVNISSSKFIFKNHLSGLSKILLLLCLNPIASIYAQGDSSTSLTIQDESESPNFLIIFVDDMGYGDLSCYGNKEVATPNIDQLASQGTRFTSFYAQVLCGPSRGALMTGRYPYRIGGGNKTNGEEVFISEILRQAGYTTGCIGKWDMSNRQYIEELVPNSQGFDEFFGTLGANDQNSVTLWENRQELRTTNDMASLSRLYTDRSIAFLESHKEEPFFLYLSHTMMHIVIDASPAFRNSTGKGLYADTMRELDHEIGRLLGKLEELGLAENTVVLLASDNGPWSNHIDRQHEKNDKYVAWTNGPEVAWGDSGPLRGAKGTTWEGGIRVPAIIRWPGHIPANRESDAIVSTLDILPSFAALAGVSEKVPTDRPMDGVNQKDYWLSKDVEGARNQFLYFHAGELQAVREGSWKLRLPGIKKFFVGVELDRGTQNTELYNLENDLGETTNVAEEHPDVVNRLMKIAKLSLP